MGLFREAFKDFAEASKMPNCHLRGQTFPIELREGVCSDNAQELSQTERGMHLNWVKGNLQLPGSREGAGDEAATSPAGLHMLPTRHSPCCPGASDPEGQQKPVLAPCSSQSVPTQFCS